MTKNFELCNTSTIDLNPCIIDYSKKFHAFIVGTYQLIEVGSKTYDEDYTEDQLAFLNNRIGSINVFNVDCKLICKHQCQSGGVFDLKISNYHHDTSSNSEMIIAAHSNGMFGIYKFENGVRIHNVQQIKTGQTMLTTIGDLFIGNILTIAIGSSDGRLLCYEFTINDSIENLMEQSSADNLIQSSTVTNDSLSIWYLKMVHLEIMESTIEQNLIFVCSEDSMWRIFTYSSKNLTKLFENCDSSYGVTSIEIFRIDHVDLNTVSIILLVGSYDEYLRIYSIELKFDHHCKETMKILQCLQQKKIHINGGGIWRILVNNDNDDDDNNNTILLSAMYSGAYWLTLEIPTEYQNGFKQNHHLNIDYKLNKFPIENDDSNENHLVYGIGSDSILSTILFASFYEKKIFLYKSCD
ncbi:uncharacterized protein LOC124500592 [Dermatophagoides farinae]|uniref:uncharacterized protein LOC124500592 n=1 Tax=Dermatophagoides farinae TaxID=6954 RepID=UPI003F61E62E